MYSFELTDRVVVVTGGGQGLGEGVAKAFAGSGATIYLASDAGSRVTGQILAVSGGL